MPVTTTSAAVHITPVVLKTFFDHAQKKRKKGEHEKEVPQDDLRFHQAFNIVKAFIELGTKNTVESLQAFTNTRVPSPYWSAVCPVTVPLSTCNDAADVLIEWFGPEELKLVVGGERWWQVRGLDGVEGEWIAERDHLDEVEPVAKGPQPFWKESDDLRRMDKLESVMLYVHGGGYFWGSINTHRFQILRYARKFKGRAFAVNYRKAPQYPWPCPLQDVLAAYLYLIRPPPGAPHSPVSPSKIVLAGDSAGGGLCLSTLTLLRDMGLPMPAGAVLISPWVDLTHSFPSVMHNTDTDIIPPHGFLAKPSTLWPVELSPETNPRVVPSESNPPPIPGHADTLKPSEGRTKIEEEGRDVPKYGYPVETQEEMLDKYPDKSNPEPQEVTQAWGHPVYRENGASSGQGASFSEAKDDEDLENWEPKPPKVLMENPNTVPLELRSQIQLYAQTEQLTHPLVSPVLQGSLGNLPPLYILAGDGEVLRDEIIYLAHRAAHPDLYPTRKGILKEGKRQMENAKKFTKPTKVHLQVFDGMCHVLTVFMFTKSARYAYRSIAEFVKHVTLNAPPAIEHSPFPEFKWDPQRHHRKLNKPRSKGSTSSKSVSASESQKERERDEKDAGDLFHRNEGSTVTSLVTNDVSIDTEPLVTKGVAVNDAAAVILVRERVDIHATVRPMEAKEAIPCLNIAPGQIGVIKEAPATRWHRGQQEWDKRFKHAAGRAARKREHLKVKAENLLKRAYEQGLAHESFPESLNRTIPTNEKPEGSLKKKTSLGRIQADRRWGPLDLGDERPPPSAIAGRTDTYEALALLKKCIYHTAPVTHKGMPRLKASDAIRAAFDPHDDPNGPPKQSVSEEQTKAAPGAALHGLRIWDKILTYLGRKGAAKASNGIKSTVDTIQQVSNPLEKAASDDAVVPVIQ